MKLTFKSPLWWWAIVLLVLFFILWQELTGLVVVSCLLAIFLSLVLLIYQRDLSRRQQAEKGRRDSEERFRRLAENAPDLIYRYRFTPPPAFEYVSPAVNAMIGYAPEEFYGDPGLAFKLVHPDDRLHLEVLKNSPPTSVMDLTLRWLHKDGTLIWTEQRLMPIVDAAGQVLAIEGVVRNVTRRKLIEDSLRASEERYRTLIERLSDGLYRSTPDGKFIEVNPAMVRMLGYASKEELMAVEIKKQLYFEEVERNTVVDKLQRAGGDEIDVFRLRHKDGHEIWVEDHGRLITGADGQIIYHEGILRDISARWHTEEALRESEERYRLLAENSLDLIELLDLDGNVVYASPSHYYVIGYTPNELVYQNLFALVHHDDVPKALLAVNELLDAKMRKTIEIRLQKKTGTWIEVEALLSGIPGPGNTIQRILFSARDIAARKRVEEHLKSSLKEKEVLLKEIHHRVKNNLQIISSLLNLQSGYIQDPQAGEMFKESRNRVKSMALIHERLYQSKDLARIDFTEYVRNLTTHLFRSYGVNARAVGLQIDVGNILLDIDTAIPCGLIINELVTNALKYAFSSDVGGEIRIGLQRENDGRLALSVSDNGAGLPPDFDFQKTESLGLQLVNTLTDQLQGQIQIEREGGTTFKIVLQPHTGFESQENF